MVTENNRHARRTTAPGRLSSSVSVRNVAAHRNACSAGPEIGRRDLLRLDGGKKLIDRPVEGLRLVDVHHMSRVWNDLHD